MAETANPYGVDEDMGLGSTLFRLVADGYDGEQIVERHGHQLTIERIGELVALYVSRVLRADGPPAPAAECLVNRFDGWCMRHGCYHPPAPAAAEGA